ncbi:phosphoadenosine phosphosulfate reductase [Suhomyces tanzawaensis NRRL Y-17324]|uniref:Phosphoadenosine phosphosulfate reductase n=1 Tax=Suhomyces tanzawaensis NRRL Y-17324 TaxID=984487 RepID=A0A1E4SB38_9ASCO|nr:phosphoadenosine phosphosulfate reductase [Suhomyces tanzawaensis NRRL Y-17324]ODV76711.1 phosphoadenosine phosphosulfate reductase [Suhomyces tanzawaensis NRRL Y-17324]
MTSPSNPVTLSPAHLAHLNATLLGLEPHEIIRWAYITFPRLYQTTAFGLTGLVTVDIIAKLTRELQAPQHIIDLIFIDTLYHFPQTYDLVASVQQKYHPKIHTYSPKGTSSEQEFVAKHGDQLWESNDSLYDFLVKVEPAQRAYKDLQVAAVLTGRRKSQGGARGLLPVVEYEEATGIYKINPLCEWDFARVKQYVDTHTVPYNVLLDLGYKSIGDWHSTVAVAEGEDERAGRWKGQAKTECGIHVTSQFSQYLQGTKT